MTVFPEFLPGRASLTAVKAQAILPTAPAAATTAAARRTAAATA